MTLGGLVLIRDGIKLDYTFRETISSLLPVCDSVVVCDGESKDGTQEEIRAWMIVEPKIKLCVYPWPNPKGHNDFYVDWIQFGRQHVKDHFVFHLDADEILSEASYPEIKRFKKLAKTKPVSLWCKRYNFWKDARHTIPHGFCLSDRVVRLAPQSVWLPSDGPHPLGAEAVNMAVASNIEIFHYGFLRRHDAFFLKARALQGYFFDSYDPRLANVETSFVPGTAGANWMTTIDNVEWANKLVPFTGNHPAIAQPWLTKRGWNYD